MKKTAATKFIVDVMLGRLARWMRILGYDTLYVPGAKDHLLIERAVNGGRCLVTRDRLLAGSARPGLVTMLIESNYLKEQLKEFLGNVKSPPPGLLSRCLVCNSILEEAGPEDAENEVPDFIFLTYRKFRRCPECRRFYWPGTHLKDIRSVLAEEGIHLD